MKAETRVKKAGADAETTFAPDVVKRVLGIAADLHAEDLTRIRRSELFDAAAHAGIPAKYVAAALDAVKTPQSTPPAPRPAAGQDDPPWSLIAAAFGFLFVLSMASVYLADLAEPWGSPFGLERWSLAAKLALCFFFWFTGLVAGILVVAVREG